MSHFTPRFTVLLPIKPPAVGKSRLISIAPDHRAELAAAFALDTVAAALATELVDAVLAITDDFKFANQLRKLGAQVMPDGVAGNMNGTLVQGAHEARRRNPNHAVVALAADLPALRPRELHAALTQAAATHPQSGRSFVRDQAGSGTTCLIAIHADLEPAFGPASALVHESTGAHPISGALPTLRQDVDDIDDLRRALALGLGQATAAVVANWGI